jgi:hypothetical protein
LPLGGTTLQDKKTKKTKVGVNFLFFIFYFLFYFIFGKTWGLGEAPKASSGSVPGSMTHVQAGRGSIFFFFQKKNY